MLIIPTYIAQSSIHGLGVFTRVAVKAGQIVSRYMPPFDVSYPKELMAVVQPAEREYLLNYSYLSVFTDVYVLTGDNDRYMNHNDQPNVGMNPDGSTTNVALRDIAADEELTCDYRSFDADWQKKLPHLCKS